MKFPILDIETLETLDPALILNHLQNYNWNRLDQRSDQNYEIWQYTLEDGRTTHVILPLDQTLVDYSSRIYDLIKTLAKVESKNPVKVLENFLINHESVA
jgi:hypothetical protein